MTGLLQRLLYPPTAATACRVPCWHCSRKCPLFLGLARTQLSSPTWGTEPRRLGWSHTVSHLKAGMLYDAWWLHCSHHWREKSLENIMCLTMWLNEVNSIVPCDFKHNLNINQILQQCCQQNRFLLWFWIKMLMLVRLIEIRFLKTWSII